MKTVHTVAETRKQVAQARHAGARIGFVPTMGALHEGHFRLIEAAGRQSDFVVVSVFVNPTQFGPGEDYQSYPRTLPADQAACEDRGVDLLLAPSVEQMYPDGPDGGRTVLHVAGLSEVLCGRDRPGHFDGVCTVVAKLLNIVQPDVAMFGQKDYQQAVILRQMVRDLNIPVTIHLCPTVREEDGLAMSSRNRYLSADHRRQARSLYAALQQAEHRIRQHHPPVSQVVGTIRDYLREHAPDGQIDYIEIADAETLQPVETTSRPIVIALAVRFGSARLIDNVVVAEEGLRA